MEIFQTIWTALSTPNPTLIQIIGIPFVFIEITVSVLLFTTLLNIPKDKFQQIRYIVLVSVISIISNNFIPKPYGPLLHMILTPFLIMFIFKISFLKSLVAEILPTIFIVLIETILIKLFVLFFNLTYDLIATIPIYRESIVILIYITIYLLYKLAQHFNFSISLLENMNKKSRNLLIFTCIVGLFAIGTQFYLIGYYNDHLPFFVILLSLLSLISYFLISIFSITRTTKLQIATEDLQQTKLYNNTLQILHDNMRAFKHDFANIVQSIGRIC